MVETIHNSKARWNDDEKRVYENLDGAKHRSKQYYHEFHRLLLLIAPKNAFKYSCQFNILYM